LSTSTIQRAFSFSETARPHYHDAIPI
jgi:hypothetical protein